LKLPERLSDEGKIKQKINQRRRQMLVHSYLYYEMDEAYIDDNTFNKWAQELAELQDKYPLYAAECVYADAFKDFDGSTGYDLPLDDPWVQKKALYLLDLHNKEN
jgi:hypothetical protein